jgi:hypothetical protein
MAADFTPGELPLADAPAPDVGRQSGGSHRLAMLFLVLLGLLALTSATGTAVSAVDALLANPAQGCGGP